MRAFLFVSVAVFFSFSASSQITQTHRYEREHKGGDEFFTIIPLKSEGLALIREKNRFTGGKQNWEIVLLDTVLTERKVIDIEVEPRHPFVGYEYIPGTLYVLYRTGETNRNSFELIEINIENATEAARYVIKPELDFRLTHFSKVGGNLVLGGYVSNEPAILLYSMSAKNITVVPGFFQKDNELVELRVNQNQTFNTVLIDRSLRSERKLVFRTFDENGKLLLEDIVPIEDDRTLQTSLSSTLIREDLVIMGSWGERQGKQSLGFFALPIDPFNEQKIKYVFFGELDHFTDYLNPKRAQRIREKTQEAVLEGGRPAYSTYVMPFKVDEYPEGYLMLADVYHPSSTANPYYSSPYSNPYYANPYYYYSPFWPGYYPGMRMYRPYGSGPSRNPEEIKTYESVLIAFDAKGNRLWDQSVNLDEIKRPSLDQLSDYFYDKSFVHFIYKEESELKSRKINLADGSANETTQKIKLSEPVDEIRSENQSEDGVRHWTGNSFYVWGYHTIRNVHKEDKVRNVFYINKVFVH